MKVRVRYDCHGVFYGKFPVKKGDLVEIEDAREVKYHLTNKMIELQNPADLTRLEAQIQAAIRRERGNMHEIAHADGGSFLYPTD
jgi:hypothetical protein